MQILQRGNMTPLCGIVEYNRVRHNAAKVQQTVADTLCLPLRMPTNSERPALVLYNVQLNGTPDQIVYTLQCPVT